MSFFIPFIFDISLILCKRKTVPRLSFHYSELKFSSSLELLLHWKISLLSALGTLLFSSKVFNRWRKAVSYTHLDVYKRQVEEAFCVLFVEFVVNNVLAVFDGVCCGNQHVDASSVWKKVLAIFSEFGTSIVSDDVTICPVSYTHLDVYKRQR